MVEPIKFVDIALESDGWCRFNLNLRISVMSIVSIEDNKVVWNGASKPDSSPLFAVWLWVGDFEHWFIVTDGDVYYETNATRTLDSRKAYSLFEQKMPDKVVPQASKPLSTLYQFAIRKSIEKYLEVGSEK